MKISYAITVCNEHKEIERLLTFLFEHSIIITFSNNPILILSKNEVHVDLLYICIGIFLCLVIFIGSPDNRPIEAFLSAYVGPEYNAFKKIGMYAQVLFFIL